MAAAAADHAARRICALTAQHAPVPVLFATGASQLETLRALTANEGLLWDRVIGFQMDEYLGISETHRASFRRYMRENLVSRVPLREFHEINGSSKDPEAVCARYGEMLRENPPQLCLLGIGENGHLAFNDPGEADFDDPVDVKVVTLDAQCRQQQVNEGWFSALAEVPTRAITLTIPTLMRIPELILSVPGSRKASVVARTAHQEISPECPATIIRKHANCHVYLDPESARLL